MRGTTPLDAGTTRAWEGGPSFSLFNRVYRAAFSIAWALFAAWTPPPLHRWRAWLLRRFGARISPTARIYRSVRIWSPANLHVSDHAVIGPGANIYSMGKISIGAYAIVSQGAHLCAGTHDVSDPNFQLKARPITIGERAWIAAEAFVGPGVSVGPGCVLGARGCAMRDLEDWMIYSGNPAIPLRPRTLRNLAGSTANIGDRSD